MPIILESPTGTGGGGSGTVTNVSSANTGIAVANPTTTPTLTLATLDVIAADGPPAANWSNNSKKITSLANGSGAQDAAAFGQIPTALPPNGSAGGDLSGTYPNPAVKAITETSGPTDLVIGTITDGQVLKRVGGTLVSVAAGAGTVTNVSSPNTSIVVTNPTTTPALSVGTLDVLATNGPPAADWSNNSHKITSLTAATAATDAASLANRLDQFAAPTANVAMNTRKLTGLAAGSAAGDSVRYEQVQTCVVLTGDATAINANTTLANITGFNFAVTSGGVFMFEFVIFYTTSTTADIKITFTAPAAANGGFAVWSGTNNNGVNQAAATANAMFAFGSGIANGGAGTAIGNVDTLMGVGLYVGGGNAGNIQLQAAQNTSDATNTVVRAGSLTRYYQAS